MTRRPWTTHRLTVESGHVVRQVSDWTSLELSAELELMRADLAEAIALLHSRHPQRAVPLLVRNGIPIQLTPSEES